MVLADTEWTRLGGVARRLMHAVSHPACGALIEKPYERPPKASDS